ncbi:MAG: transketolase [Planctomycetota bacterium]|mgnify:CR=1 FL=1
MKTIAKGPERDALVADLKTRAIRIRRRIVEMIAAAGSGHPGGSLSAVEIVTALYFAAMRHKPSDPFWADRDRFILSKGHGAPVLYAALMEAGYLDESLLPTFRKLGSPLQGHPDRRFLPILEASTGSLGQGLSIGIGRALAARLDKRDSRVYVLLGDGECDEGQIWEAAMFAGNRGLDNLCAIVDYNRLQLDGYVDDIQPLEPLAAKWAAFRWNVVEIDGHDFGQVLDALERAETAKGKPTCIVAKTVKGKGVSFMENVLKWHGVAPTADEAKRALAEIGGAR